MADENKQNLVDAEDMEAGKTPKGDKKKSSKRWRKKSSKGELSPAQKEFLERGKQQSDLGDEESKAKAKEKKSFKGRIRKISLRKLSKTEKKNSMDQGETSFDTEQGPNEDFENKEKEKQESASEIDGKVDKDEGDDLPKDDIEHEEKSANGDEGLQSGKTEEVVENGSSEEGTSQLLSEDGRDEASHLETSTEVRKREDVERRKSKEIFDTVIVELANKDVQQDGIDGENGEDTGLGNNNVNMGEGNPAAEKPEENETTENEAVTESNNIDNLEIEVEDMQNEKEKLLSDIEEEQTERKKDSLIDNEVQADHKNEDEADDAKTFRPIKDDNLDISQKIAKKAMGKVVGRYRQVQLTKTYCACCSVM